MRNLFHILALLIAVSILGSCNTNGCLENRNAVPYAGFYDSSTGSAITLDSLQIYGLGMSEDDPISAAGERISALYLPMRSTQQSTGWIIAYKWSYLDYPQLNDTIVFDYTSSPRFASEECGVIYDYHIDEYRYTTHLIDSVIVTDSLITNIDLERIKVYFRTSSDDDTTEVDDRPVVNAPERRLADFQQKGGNR